MADAILPKRSLCPQPPTLLKANHEIETKSKPVPAAKLVSALQVVSDVPRDHRIVNAIDGINATAECMGWCSALFRAIGVLSKQEGADVGALALAGQFLVDRCSENDLADAFKRLEEHE